MPNEDKRLIENRLKDSVFTSFWSNNYNENYQRSGRS